MVEPSAFATDGGQLASPHLRGFAEGVVADAVFKVLGQVGSSAVNGGIAAFRRRFGKACEQTLKKAESPQSLASVLSKLTDDGNSAINELLGEELADLWQYSEPVEIESRIAQAVERWEVAHQRQSGPAAGVSNAEVVEALCGILQNLREATYRDLFAYRYRQVISVDRKDRSQVEDIFIRLRAGGGEHRNENSEEARSNYRLVGPEYLDFRSQSSESIEATLREARNIVVLGVPGSGKSTLLRYLAAVCAESGTGYLPVFLRLRDYGDSDEDRIAEHARQFAEGQLQLVMEDGFFERALSVGRCLVCLDALDEVQADARRRVVGRAEALVQRYPNNRFIITSRAAGYDEEPLNEQAFARYVVQPMRDDDVNKFIDLQFDDGWGHSQTLRQTLHANPTLKVFATNPLLLTIRNLVYRNDGATGLPLNRTAFYERAVNILIADKDDEGVSVVSDERDRPFYEYRKEILVAIAHHLQSIGRETIGKNDLLRVIGRFLGVNPEIPVNGPLQARREAEAFVELAERRTGLLVEQNAGNGEFGFLHSTFREYLAAQHIYLSHFSSGPDAYWEEIKDHIDDKRWREVILLLLGSLDERYCTYLTEKILAAGSAILPLDFEELPGRLGLAAGALANRAPMTEKLHQEIVARLANLIPRRSSDGDIAFRHSWFSRNAVRALGEIRHIPDATVPVLASIANDLEVDEYNRIVAARALGAQGETAAAVTVLTAIANNPTPFYHASVDAAVALHDLGERAGAITVLAGVANNPSVHADERVRAAQYLGRFGESTEEISALTVIANNPSTGVHHRIQAARILGGLGESDPAITVLTDIANGPAASDVERIRSARTLGNLGQREIAIPMLTAIARDPDGRTVISIRAAEALGAIGESTIAKAVLTGIGNDPEAGSQHRIWAAQALAGLGEYAAAIAVPTTIANDPGSGVRDRMRAARALGTLGGSTKAIAVLNAIANDPATDDKDKEYARIALTRFSR